MIDRIEKMDHLNELLSDEAFAEETILMYTDVHRKRYVAEQNMIRKFRANFKRGDPYGTTILDTIFPDPTKEQIYRQQVLIDRMDKRMKCMEEGMKCMEEQMKSTFLSQSQKIQTLTQEKEEMQEEFYDCQAELIQQKEYVNVFLAEEALRQERMQQHIQKIKEYVETTDRELEGIKRTLKSLTRSPYSVSESVNRLKERKETLLKQKQRYKELMVFLE
jgi:hypothetical protein